MISYGFPEPAPTDATIALAYRRDRGMALLRICDNGAPFDPTAIDEPDVPEDVEHAAIGGHGVQLMRHLLDEFSYCHADGNNQRARQPAPRHRANSSAGVVPVGTK